MSGNGRKVRIFGINSFESKWVVAKRGWLNHHWLCDGHVAVHESWYERGYRHAATYDPDSVNRAEILDWCQDNAPNESIVHPNGAVLFIDGGKAEEFAIRWR